MGDSPRFATAEQLHAATARFDREAEPGVVRTPRYRLRYVTWGRGTPAVIVHGMNDLPRSFSMVMARLVDAGFRVIAYHLADGETDGCRLAAYQHADFTADLVALLDHLAIGRADILGSSFGSTIALRSLATHPTRFGRAVLQGGFARRPLIPAERALTHMGRNWPGRMGDLPIRRLVMIALEKPTFAATPNALFRALLANSGRTPIRASALRGLLIDRLDLRPLLPSVPHPVLMIGGDRDAIVPRAYEAEVEAGLPDVRRVEFAPCGHYPQYTLPDPTADELIPFWSSAGPARMSVRAVR